MHEEFIKLREGEGEYTEYTKDFKDLAMSLIEKYNLDVSEAMDLHHFISNYAHHIMQFNEGLYNGFSLPTGTGEKGVKSSENFSNAYKEFYEQYKEYIDYFNSDFDAKYYADKADELRKLENEAETKAANATLKANELKENLLAQLQNTNSVDGKSR